MTGNREIVRIAARGDGVTEDGEHVSGAVPGDVVEPDGGLIPGPHRVTPACQHFGTCGGCQLQHGGDDVLRRFVRERVVNAAMGQGLAVVELRPEHLSPAQSRRRTGLHGIRINGGAVLGYREAASHKVVDLQHCPVLDPQISGMIAPLRRLLSAQGPKASVDFALTLCDQGVDLALTHFALEGLETTEAVLEFAKNHELARVSVDQGYGPETVWEPESVTITLSGLPVSLPAGAFLQATRDAEVQMIADAADWLGDARVVADLFSGLGTFAFALAQGQQQKRKVFAVEADQAAHLSCKLAAARTGGRVIALHRDLFRNPLQASELERFDAVLLDPPRAGAKAQVAEISASSLERVIYISCNPSSWARDGAVLAEAGFNLKKLRPIGQFRWSTHVELVSLFER